MENSKVHFCPWVGTDYKTGGVFNKRIMVLGESHYCDDCDDNEDYTKSSDFTSGIVNEYLDYRNGIAQYQKWMPTYERFERSLVGHETTGEESRAVWQSVLFYNYIQVFMTASNQRPTSEQYQSAQIPFFEVLNRYEPDYLIAWGKSDLFNHAPGTNWQIGKDLSFADESGKSGAYKLDNGKLVKTLFVKHPAARFTPYSWEKWYEIIKQFFAED